MAKCITYAGRVMHFDKVGLTLTFENVLIPILKLSEPSDRKAVETLLANLRLSPSEIALSQGNRSGEAASVQKVMADVAKWGDEALVEVSRRFDDPEFTVDQIRVDERDMRDASKRLPVEQRDALKRSIDQVREYQTHILPQDPPLLRRDGVELGLRFTPIDSVGLMVPGGKAAYPSSVIMLAVPAQIAGVKRIVVCTPPSRYGRSDIVLAAYHELGLTEVYRAGGAAAVAALAFGTATIAPVDKIVGPGNTYMQLAKRALAGAVGIDGYLGPSEILVLADESANPAFIASDLLAQAEHDPGSCFLLTTSPRIAAAVSEQLEKQLATLSRADAIRPALRDHSAIIVDESMDRLIELANRYAAEHVNIQTADDASIAKKICHAGAIFLGVNSPVAAGDYVCGPSHCLPTNTTARFSSGISVYEFLKRTSVVRYDVRGITADSAAIIAMAGAEHLDAHAASVKVRLSGAEK